MKMKKPVISFVEINMDDSIVTVSPPSCTNCAIDGGRYTGGGMACFGDMQISTTCTDSMSIALGDGGGNVAVDMNTPSGMDSASGTDAAQDIFKIRF